MSRGVPLPERAPIGRVELVIPPGQGRAPGTRPSSPVVPTLPTPVDPPGGGGGSDGNLGSKPLPGADLPPQPLDHVGSDCWWRWRTSVGACPICAPQDGRRINQMDIDWDTPPLHPNCRCWLEFDYCDDPELEPPFLPPIDPPGPGPY